MFVSARKHRALQLELELLKIKHELMLLEHNQLVRRINAKGGQDFLLNGVLPKSHAKLPFTPDDIKRLIVLCHPDKHDGKESAKLMTQKLLAYRERMS